MENGKGRYIHVHYNIMCIFGLLPVCMKLKKVARLNSSNFKRGMANMHKKRRRQGRNGLVMMVRLATSPILSQRSPST